MERKAKPVGYIEPMPKKLFRILEKDFNEKGGRFVMGPEIDKHLSAKKAEASTLNSKTILFKKNVGRAAVYEELIHAKQYEDGRNDGSYESVLRNEIEAQETLISNATEYELTANEIIQTRNALDSYRAELEMFLKGGTI